MTILEYSVEVAPLDDATRDRLMALDTTLLSDAMSGRGTMAAAIGPVAPGMKVVGPARTAYSPGAVEAAILAIAACKAGEVVVIDGGGGVAHASLGGIMALDAECRGAAGCIINGAVRDTAELRESGFPIFARASTPHGAGAEPDGHIGAPVTCGGVGVNPGDIIVGDDDGVVVIPPADLEAVLTAAETKGGKEAGWIAALKSGRSLKDVHGFPDAEPA
jgi:regulator of RNase E activity RraA